MSSTYNYPDNYFDTSLMSFGDHLEELRWRLWTSLKALGICMLIGFVLDQIGDAINVKWFGVGKPVMQFITEPVQEQVREFYKRRTDLLQKRIDESKKNQADVSDKLNQKYTITGVKIVPKDGSPPTEADLELPASQLYVATQQGNYLSEATNFLTVLSVQEGMVVYFKVSLLCGLIIACPVIMYQFWAFIGAGLYPHEKRYIRVYFGAGIGLFLGGIMLCQFYVMPKAVNVLLGVNEWIGFDPDLRLREWLGFAIILPLVFGVSFLTPLVMIFFNRIGAFSWKDYLTKWRHAVMIIAFASAILTPTPDIITMLYLFVPMMGLYMGGILVCYMLPPPVIGPAAFDQHLDGQEVAI